MQPIVFLLCEGWCLEHTLLMSDLPPTMLTLPSGYDICIKVLKLSITNQQFLPSPPFFYLIKDDSHWVLQNLQTKIFNKMCFFFFLKWRNRLFSYHVVKSGNFIVNLVDSLCKELNQYLTFIFLLKVKNPCFIHFSMRFVIPKSMLFCKYLSKTMTTIQRMLI